MPTMLYASPCLYVLGDIDDFEPLMVLDRPMSAAETKVHLESFVIHELEARLRFDRCIASGSKQEFSPSTVPGISIVRGCPYEGTGNLVFHSKLTGEMEKLADTVSELIRETLARVEHSKL